MPDGLVSIHGRKLMHGHGDFGPLYVDGYLAVPHPRNPRAQVVLFDDFLGDTIQTALWGNPTKGSDGATVDFAFSAAVGGMLRGTTGAGAGGSMAANGIQLYSSLAWKPNQGNLMFEARVKISAITNISLFVGFTDQVAALEQPIHSAASANTITTNASDGVGFFFDTSMTDDVWWCAGVKGDTDATHTSGLATAPVAATWAKLRIEIDTSGNATFWVDGIRYGYVANATTATVALTPTVSAFTRTAASATVDIDYIDVRADRA